MLQAHRTPFMLGILVGLCMCVHPSVYAILDSMHIVDTKV